MAGNKVAGTGHRSRWPAWRRGKRLPDATGLVIDIFYVFAGRFERPAGVPNDVAAGRISDYCSGAPLGAALKAKAAPAASDRARRSRASRPGRPCELPAPALLSYNRPAPAHSTLSAPAAAPARGAPTLSSPNPLGSSRRIDQLLVRAGGVFVVVFSAVVVVVVGAGAAVNAALTRLRLRLMNESSSLTCRAAARWAMPARQTPRRPP